MVEITSEEHDKVKKMKRTDNSRRESINTFTFKPPEITQGNPTVWKGPM